MGYRKLFPVFAALIFGAGIASATTIHQCEDEQGNRTFEKHCPPGSTVIETKRYASASPVGASASALPALVLYAVPDCDVCDEVREYLAVKNLSFTEKNVQDNGTLQVELKNKTGGELRVPVLLIGEQVLPGYDRAKLAAALKDAGFELAENEEIPTVEPVAETVPAEENP